MKTKPNVILIYADDLGRGLLSCYGQKHFQTPNIDRIAREGMQFGHAYGCHMCAPARASLLCGIHDCHAGSWTFTKPGIYEDYARGKLTLEDVYELIHNTGIEHRSEDIFLPMVFKQAGYVTGQIGKLEWGFATTGEEIQRHGWDYHYGYYDHQMCHGFFPPFMFENNRLVNIDGNTDPNCGRGYPYTHPKFWEYKKDKSDKKHYSQDLFDQKIVSFINANKDKPFFLYHPSQLPHGFLTIPSIYPELLDNKSLNEMEKEYASMVIKLDETVKLVQDTLDKLGIADNTIIAFTSDNGHCFYYGWERNGYGLHVSKNGKALDHFHVRYTTEAFGDVFDGNNSMTGCKLSSFEGGVRVPLLISWPGYIKSGSKTDIPIANYDFMATMAELLGTNAGKNKDGLSYLPLLLGQEDFQSHDYLVYGAENGPALLTREGWKFRTYIHKNYNYGTFGATWSDIPSSITFTLHNIFNDHKEENNLIDQEPEIARKLKHLLLKECDGNFIHGTTQPHFAFMDYDIESKSIGW